MGEAQKDRVRGNSPYVQVLKEATQSAELRRGLIREIQQAYQAKVVTYFTSFAKPDAQISDDDAEMLESVLAAEHKGGGKILLILNSPGGQALAAERIVNVFRSYSGGAFEVLVPHSAKSAATMVCFGGNAIHMSPTAELGPVDPQVPYKISPEEEWPRWISADEYVRSYDSLIESASSGKAKRLEPFLQQLARFDARYMEQLRSLIHLSEDISIRLLKASMMLGKTEKEIRECIQLFLTQTRTSSHGRMINAEAAKTCGLNIKPIELGSPAWHAVWELYVRGDWAVTHSCTKIIETSESAAQQ